MTKYLPAGCKSAKVNLSGAYRTTLTRLEVGDVVRLDRRQNEVNGALIPTPTHSPARSFWATVREITRSGGQIHITTDKGQMPADFAHTSITRKERVMETQERLALDAQAREDAVRQAEEERIQTALAEHPTPAEAAAMPAPAVPAIPFMCGSHAHRTQAERTECQATAARLTAHTVPLADPADLAADLVRIGREGNIPEPITHALNVVGQLLDAADAADRAYYGKVYAELQTLLRRAMKVASDAAMRQVADPEPERAVLGEPMCLGDFGAYGACIAVPGHPGKCMDAFGHRFDGRNRAAAVDVDRALDSAFPAVASPDRTKLLNAEGTVRNLLADAKQVLDVAWARGGDQADAAAKARVDALTEVLALLIP